MTRFRLLGAAAMMAAFAASPASAQHMIDEPGMFAFTHPNGDLGIASTRAPADARAMVPISDRGRMRAMEMRVMPHAVVARRAKSDKSY
jgi:hypothetical protein